MNLKHLHKEHQLDKGEIEKELGDYLSKKLGARVKVVTPGKSTVSKTAQERDEGKGAQRSNGVNKIHFDMKPEELEAYLNEHIIRQDEAKAILAMSVA